MAFLSIENVSMHFASNNGRKDDTFCVFDDISLCIKKGEFVTVIGHSGCGKSTLLNIIAGFERPMKGSVILDNKEVTEPGLDRMVVFQNFALMPWLTAAENVMLAVKAANGDRGRKELEEHVSKYINMMGLDDAAQKKPAYLSGGMRQRVGLARAFAVEPKVLLLDEPFAQIDALTRGLIQEELIRMWNASRNTVFMVTHDVDEAILLSDRIVLMSNSPNAMIAQSYEVNIPRPRSRATMIDMPEYTALRTDILRFLVEGANNHTQ